MHIEFLVEEVSAEAALKVLLPKIIQSRATWTIHPFAGKPDLLGKLPTRLKGYFAWLPVDWRILVLIDEDREDCLELKIQMEGAAAAANLVTPKTRQGNQRIQVVNRIVVEELEAWFFGDADALRSAFPGVPTTLEKQSKYRNSDAVKGGTWEQLERVLQRAGYYSQGLAKIEAARKIALQMEPSRNRSESFAQFRGAIETLLTG